MTKLLKEIKYDLSFIRSHSLQTQWYKVFKVFMIVGVVAGYYLLFGTAKTVAFFASFMLLSLVVHLTYRVKTQRFKQSWLDFVVVEENGESKAKSIGRFYYSAIAFNAILSVVVSQVWF